MIPKIKNKKPLLQPEHLKITKAGGYRQHGVTYPKRGTSSFIVFDMCERFSKAAKRPITREEILQEASELGFQQDVVHVYYHSWRRFHGLTQKNAPAFFNPFANYVDEDEE